MLSAVNLKHLGYTTLIYNPADIADVAEKKKIMYLNLRHQRYLRDYSVAKFL